MPLDPLIQLVLRHGFTARWTEDYPLPQPFPEISLSLSPTGWGRG
jgi:hypothetical protein